jgi:hypothetical protein
LPSGSVLRFKCSLESVSGSAEARRARSSPRINAKARASATAAAVPKRVRDDEIDTFSKGEGDFRLFRIVFLTEVVEEDEQWDLFENRT